MCSICGGTYPLEIIKKASQKMLHRGPDFSGEFECDGVSLAHNRLSIIDLDKEANQPFISPMYPHLVLVFNGEIYNYLELKAELEKEGVEFKTKSDTEVLLAMYAKFGTRALQKLNGDFAFVIYDKHDKSFFLARDRLGNKPLFYSLKNNRLIFASEIKAILEVVGVAFCEEEVSKWLLFGNGSGEETIYKDIYEFPKAHFGTFKNGKFNTERYWNLEIKQEINDLSLGVEELEELLLSSLRLRLRSDVKVAMAVSGGIDSSILAALVCKNNLQSEFFGICFKGIQEANEKEFMQNLANTLKLKLEIVEASMQAIKSDFKDLVFFQDEIFRSFSIYMQYVLFKNIALKDCKVVLSGQGADELFGGYYHHVGRYIFSTPNAFKDRIRVYGNEALREYLFGLKCSLAKEEKLQLFTEDNQEEIAKLFNNSLPIPSMEHLLERFQMDFDLGLWLDTLKYNLPNLLRYEDRNAMAHSLENRTPFTDYRVVEFAFKLSNSLKFQKGYSKYILRVLLDRLGLKELAWRKGKVGFGVPERAIMQTLGYNYQSLFDIRYIEFQILRERE
ncbi:asparagine synthase (glutamine-hydrolyzing) [Helicobacter valdiviensis]|uniref:asparagine synthase (glutamine-hydrolyzing) n=1 Tax=Helicobacter valdiviensis TaxID=1458358 RepID=A0A2W6PPK3_9HELI|nr:asparagine synthase (glutamine-hydrolyzing) [Helicobacter valdiviensis]PZT48653.1 asparagine synthase (glutamine-hydrolyzing) [Helicobacter valdiviensis]